MRLTVGPLPPAVYWRRRALVLGVLLVVIVLLAYSCGDSGGSNGKPRNAGATSAAPQGAGAAATESDQSPTPSTSTSPAASPTPARVTPDRTFCTDNELQVTPAPANRRLARGATTQIVLKIQNRSGRTCKRDVGADQQELYIVENGGAQKIWSSDDCGGPRGTKVQSFTPGLEVAYTATWNGRQSTNCKDRPLPAAGEYQLYGRLGTKRSEPVTITLS